MEYCGGGSLQEKIKNPNQPLSRSRKWQLALDIIHGLAYIHSQGTLHRDLKADNVLLDIKGRAKLADLGLAQADRLLAPVEAKGIAGTKYIPCAAPEECLGKGSCQASDIYAFGILLWQIETGKSPYSSIASISAIKSKIIAGETEIIPDNCPIEIKSLIKLCWEKDPKNRPSASDLTTQLEQIGGKFCLHSTIVRVLKRTEFLTHSFCEKSDNYIVPFSSGIDVQEDWDSFWRRQEGREDKEAYDIKLLNQNIDIFLDGTSKLLLLQGDGGVGKTLATYQISHRLASSLHENLEQLDSKHLPIFIRPGLAGWTSSDLNNGIVKALKSKVYELSDDKAIANLKQAKILFIVDGYDELNLNTPRRNIMDQLKFNGWPKAKLLVTCRRCIFDRDEMAHLFGTYKTCYILPFSISQMVDYLKNTYNLSTEQIIHHQEQIQQSDHLRNILRNPFVLSLFSSAIATFDVRYLNSITRYAVYQHFISYWLNQAVEMNLLSQAVKEKLGGNLQQSFDRFSSSIGQLLFKAKTLQSDCKALKTIYPAWMDIENIVTCEARLAYQQSRYHIITETDYVQLMQAKAKQFLMGSPLQRRANSYSFIHKSFYEYFITRFIINVLLDDSKLSEKVKLLTMYPLREEPEVFKFWYDFWKDSIIALREKIEKILFDILYSSKNCPENGLAASNAITLLNLSKVSFMSFDLSYLSVPSATLNYAHMPNANGSYGDWTAVTFKEANLSNMNFNWGTLRNVNFGERAPISSIGEIVSAAYSKKSSILALGLKEGVIELRHVASGKLLYRLGLEQICSVAISSNGCLKAFGCCNGLIVLYSTSNYTHFHFLSALKCHTGRVITLKFDYKANFLASGGEDHIVCLYRIANASSIIKLKTFIGHEDPISSIDFSIDGKYLASASLDRTVRIWEVPYDIAETKGGSVTQKILCRHEKDITNVNFCNDYLISVGKDNIIQIWDIRKFERVSIFNSSCEVCSIFVDSRRKELAVVGFDGSLRLWNIENPEKYFHYFPFPIENQLENIKIAKLHQTKHMFIVGNCDGTIGIWQLNLDMFVKTFKSFVAHSKEVTDLDFDQEGNFLISTSLDQTSKLWDITDLENIQFIDSIEGHAGRVEFLQFNAAEDLLISGGHDETLRLWGLKKLDFIHRYPPRNIGNIRSTNLNLEGILAISTEKEVLLLNIQNPSEPKTVKTIKFEQDQNQIVCLYEKFLIIGDDEGRINCQNFEAVDTNCKYVTGHTDSITVLCLNTNKQLLVSGSLDANIRVWRIDDSANIFALALLGGHTEKVTAMNFNLNGDLLVSGSSDQTIRLWNTENPSTIICNGLFRGHMSSITATIFHSENRWVMSASRDKTVRFWDVSSELLSLGFQPERYDLDYITALAFEKSNNRLISGSRDGTLRIWDIKNLANIKCICFQKAHTNVITAIVTSKNGEIISAGKDGKVHMWQLKGEKLIETNQTIVVTAGYNLMINLNEQSELCTLCGNNEFIHFIHLRKIIGQPIMRDFKQFRAHDDLVSAVCFNPAGNLLATGSWSGAVKIWCIKSLVEIELFWSCLSAHEYFVQHICFNSIGNMFATSSFDETIKLWELTNLPDSKVVAKKTLRGHTSGVSVSEFSPKKNILASAGADHVVRLWDVRSKDKTDCTLLEGHLNEVTSLAFDGSGNFLATGSLDKTIKLWNVKDTFNVFLVWSSEGLGLFLDSMSFKRTKGLDLENQRLLESYASRRKKTKTIGFFKEASSAVKMNQDVTVKLPEWKTMSVKP